eukprot:5339943-Prymnesium_polylepis.1
MPIRCQPDANQMPIRCQSGHLPAEDVEVVGGRGDVDDLPVSLLHARLAPRRVVKVVLSKQHGAIHQCNQSGGNPSCRKSGPEQATRRQAGRSGQSICSSPRTHPVAQQSISAINQGAINQGAINQGAINQGAITSS